MRTEWAVLTDLQRARIFARAGGVGWQDIRNLTRNAEHQTNGREVRLPAAMERFGAAVRLPAGDSDDFLERLARELRTARKRGDFDALILVAPDDALELLKAALDPATRRMVTSAVPGNLVNLPLREARRELARRF